MQAWQSVKLEIQGFSRRDVLDGLRNNDRMIPRLIADPQAGGVTPTCLDNRSLVHIYFYGVNKAKGVNLKGHRLKRLALDNAQLGAKLPKGKVRNIDATKYLFAEEYQFELPPWREAEKLGTSSVRSEVQEFE